MSCPFCDFETVLDGGLVYVRYDKFPVSNGHCLIIPKRHVETWFDMTQEEQQEAFALIDQVKAMLDEKCSPDGYNIGMNCGETAGQTIPHADDLRGRAKGVRARGSKGSKPFSLNA